MRDDEKCHSENHYKGRCVWCKEGRCEEVKESDFSWQKTKKKSFLFCLLEIGEWVSYTCFVELVTCICATKSFQAFRPLICVYAGYIASVVMKSLCRMYCQHMA